MKCQIKVIIVLLFCCSLSLKSVVHELITDNPELARQNFKSLLHVNELAIVHFNPYASDVDTTSLDELADVFQEVSDKPRYQAGDITFIAINVHQHPTIAAKYGLEPLTGEPPEDASVVSTILLFKHGKPYKKDGTQAKLEGDFTKSQLKKFIEGYFKKSISRAIKRKKERMKVQPEEYYPESYSSGHTIIVHIIVRIGATVPIIGDLALAMVLALDSVVGKIELFFMMVA